MSNYKILDSVKSIPNKVFTNDDLSKIMDTSDEWIYKRTGIKSRHVAVDETTSSMSIDVAKKLLQKSEIDPKKVDYIIVATMSSDFQTPSTAATVQGSIGADNATAFDINAACTGFTYGTSIIDALLNKKPGSIGILIGAEVLSKYINWQDRSTAVLFGDGAAGVLVQNERDSDSQILGESLSTFGQYGMSLTAGHFSDKTPFGDGNDQQNQYLQMDGHQIFDFALKEIPKSINGALDDAKLDENDIDFYIMHQANARIIKSICRKMNLDPSKVPVNIGTYGNTAAASEAILLAEMLDSGKIHRGDKLALVGFGGGLTAGTVIIRY